jgi:hypothetical protein
VKKVYLVTSGEWSDYQIMAIFSHYIPAARYMLRLSRRYYERLKNNPTYGFLQPETFRLYRKKYPNDMCVEVYDVYDKVPIE